MFCRARASRTFFVRIEQGRAAGVAVPIENTAGGIGA